MTTTNYITTFNELVSELKAHTQVELLSYHTFAGLSLEKINSLETQYNCLLDDNIRSFYNQSNGLQLRWILKSNPDYEDQKYPVFQENTAPVAWDYAVESFEKEDACVFLLPLEKIFQQLVLPDTSQGAITIDEKTYQSVEFYANIRPMDLFSYYCNMAFFFRKNQAPLILMGDEQGTCFVDSKVCNFDTYLNFLIASKCLCSRRKEFFGQAQGYQEPPIVEIPTNVINQWTLDKLVLSQRFPLANQLGNKVDYINTLKMQQKAAQNMPLSQENLKELVAQHQAFLESGGGGATWTIIGVGERSLAIYDYKHLTKGKQAIFDLSKLEDGVAIFEGLNLPYSSCCGIYAKGVNFKGINLEGSVLIDANFENANFENANLKDVDFSRSNLQGVNFKNAILEGVDFENCNLQGANFKGALMNGSQFKGAILDNVLI